MAQLIHMADAKTGRAWPQYLILSLFLAVTVMQETGSIGFLLNALLHPAAVAAEPFALRAATSQIGNGPFAGNTLLAVNGKPFRSVNEFLALLHSSKPGDRLRLTLSDPSGAAREEIIPLPGHVYNKVSDVVWAWPSSAPATGMRGCCCF